MGWVKVDTRFPSHPKTLDIGPLGEALWLRGICYAGEQMTDGFIPSAFIRRMGDMKAGQVAARLVAAGLWHQEDGGYRIHDFLAWQRSRDEVAEVRGKRAEAGRRGGQQKASNLLANAKQTPSNLGSKNLPDTEADTDTDTDQNPSVPEGTPNPPDDEGEGTGYSAAFDAFWSRYPKTSGTKAAAFRAWQRLRPSAAVRGEIHAGLTPWITSQHWANGYVVYAERFLRDRQWEDAPPAPKSSNGHHAGVVDEDVRRLRIYDAEKQERKTAMFLSEVEPDNAEMAQIRSRVMANGATR